jgi:hypothetical protein
MGKCPHPPKRVLEQGNRRPVEISSGTGADTAGQLLQLPDEMRGYNFTARNIDLHDEMFLKIDVYNGGDGR